MHQSGPFAKDQDYTFLHDLGNSVAWMIFIDASAANCIIEREGLAKVRHVDVNVLWLLEQEVGRRWPLHKIVGSVDPAYFMTNNLALQDISKYGGSSDRK